MNFHASVKYFSLFNVKKQLMVLYSYDAGD